VHPVEDVVVRENLVGKVDAAYRRRKDVAVAR
jgi:hypothetical protein